MSTNHRIPRDNSERAARLALPPLREYHVPGGPLAGDLGTVDVAKLAEIERGGALDNAR